MAENAGTIPHTLILEERNRLSVSGVSDVDSFDEEKVTVFTALGQLVVSGTELHIERLSVETGELILEGTIRSLVYHEETRSGGLLTRLFK